MFARLMGLKTISPVDLHRLLQDPGPVTVIDVNTRSSWMNARVPGAHNLGPADYRDDDLPRVPINSTPRRGSRRAAGVAKTMREHWDGVRSRDELVSEAYRQRREQIVYAKNPA